MRHFRAVIFISTLFCASIVAGNCLYHPSDLQRRAEAEEDFSYTGISGPLGWAGLSKNNTACSTSSIQSPINLDDSVGGPVAKIKIAIPDVKHAEFDNVGTTIWVMVNGTTKFLGKTYKMSQFHFHTPSEHRINEEYFPLEMHMVHRADDGTILVLGAVFELTAKGDTTELLTAVSKNIDKLASPGSSTQTGPLVFQPLISHFQKAPLAYYTGSLTTPPCTDGVKWIFAKKPLPFDVKTYLAFKKILKFNSRYTQNTPGHRNLIEVAASQLPRRRTLSSMLSSAMSIP
ncbi:Bifunctional monodehydroascorbate reductase and carbonic anhydrase nectarin-3 [Hypsizygus marmoreus]|uniref:Carbonic anhydrase n=1 Tax=Hypsizygus marmoreus TaxID=39966 RepID=A0A369JB37_HYPMA|nr:Bifunctional monodehydroascorbate reductase and carbonic anhydrase nectarin-3 [Hypsizygus marmoreus]